MWLLKYSIEDCHWSVRLFICHSAFRGCAAVRNFFERSYINTAKKVQQAKLFSTSSCTCFTSLLSLIQAITSNASLNNCYIKSSHSLPILPRASSVQVWSCLLTFSGLGRKPRDKSFVAMEMALPDGVMWISAAELGCKCWRQWCGCQQLVCYSSLWRPSNEDLGDIILLLALSAPWFL